MRPAGGSPLGPRATGALHVASAVGSAHVGSVCTARCVLLCAQFRQDPRVLGAVLINCNAGTAGFFESYSDRVRTRAHTHTHKYSTR